MAKILVSLVSDQTIPNVSFIKSSEIYDQYWFLTTSYTEGEEKDGNRNSKKSKSDWIINTCQIQDKSSKIEVIEDDLDGIQKSLSNKVGNHENDFFTLNMTCGTKMMSLGAYLFFSQKGSKIYYTPIGKNYFKNIESTEQINSTFLTIKEYLSAYGINFKNKLPLKDANFNYAFFEFFKTLTFNNSVIDNLRIHYRGKKKIKIEDVENFKEETESDKGKKIIDLSKFLSDSKFSLINDGFLQKNEIEFLTGGWFEEFVYFKIKNQLNLSEKDQILIGVILEKSDLINENDLDVVVIRNNKFIVIECKTKMQIEGKVTQLFNETIYKASALKNNFGLFVESYLFTLEDLSQNDYLKKAKILGVRAVDKNQILDESNLKLVINKF